MAKQKIGNVDIDLATADEIGAAVAEALRQQNIRQSASEPRRIRGASAGKTDAGGNLSLDVYNVPPGHELALSRLIISSPAGTAGVPVAWANSFVNMLRSGTLVDFYPKVTGGLVLPLRDIWGNHDAPLFRNGEIVQIQFFGFDPGAGVTIEIQGWEDRTSV